MARDLWSRDGCYFWNRSGSFGVDTFTPLSVVGKYLDFFLDPSLYVTAHAVPGTQECNTVSIINTNQELAFVDGKLYFQASCLACLCAAYTLPY